jgi:tetratricopeptide (TPR) repeat protein
LRFPALFVTVSYAFYDIRFIERSRIMSPALVIVLGISIASQQPAAKQTLTQPSTPRVAVVNVGQIFTNWEKAKKLKMDLEAAADPYNRKAKDLQTDISSWESRIAKKDFSTASKEEYEDKIANAKRQLEDLAKVMRKELGKKSENDLVALWREMQTAISEYSTQNNIEVVFGYGDPLDKRLTDLFPNVNRKMNAMDGGAALPLFVAPRADISAAIADMLNQWYRAEKESAKNSPPPRRELPPAITIASRTFELPVKVEAANRKSLQEIRLYVKTPKSGWSLQAAAGPNVEQFSCKTPEDGEYWYLLVTVDKQGRTTPADLKEEPPHLRVMVASNQMPAGKDHGKPDSRIRASAYPAENPLGGWTPSATSSRADATQPLSAFLTCGHYRLRQGDFHAAIADYSDAIRLSPKESIAFMGRAASWYRLGKFEKALADLDTVTRLEPKNTEPYLARGMVRFAQGEFDQAIAEIDGALRLDSRCPNAHQIRGRFWHAKGDLTKAIADFDVALRLEPTDYDIHFLRGRVHGEEGNYAKAVEDFTRYIKQNPAEGRGYGMRSLAYFALGDAARGQADAVRAIVSDAGK